MLNIHYPDVDQDNCGCDFAVTEQPEFGSC